MELPQPLGTPQIRGRWSPQTVAHGRHSHSKQNTIASPNHWGTLAHYTTLAAQQKILFMVPLFLCAAWPLTAHDLQSKPHILLHTHPAVPLTYVLLSPSIWQLHKVE